MGGNVLLFDCETGSSSGKISLLASGARLAVFWHPLLRFANFFMFANYLPRNS
jgi:hypothetical protein